MIADYLCLSIFHCRLSPPSRSPSDLHVLYRASLLQCIIGLFRAYIDSCPTQLYLARFSTCAVDCMGGT